MREEQILKSYITAIRKKYNIKVFPGDVPCVCNECDLENMRFADMNDFGYVHIKLSSFGINEPFHRSSLIGFNTNMGPKWFLVDPTYGQFFKNKKFINYMSYNHAEFSATLLEQGYIECNLESMISYIDGFANSNAFIKPLNNQLVYQRVYDFLLDNNIISNNKRKR